MRRIMAMIMTMIFIALLTVPVMATNVPSIPPNRAVLDTANLLSSATIEHLYHGNNTLGFETGGEVLFYTRNFIPRGQDIENYAMEVFNAWGLGYPHNNGILVMIAAQEADNSVWVMTGAGIADYFTGATVNRYLDTYFHEHVVAGDYDTAVTLLFDALSDGVYRHYVQVLGAPSVQQIPFDQRQTLPAEPVGLGQVIPAAVVIIIILWVFSSISRVSRRGRGMMGPMGGPMMPRRRGFGWGGFMGGFLLGRGTANRQNRGGQAPRTGSAPPPKPFGGGGYTRGGGFGGMGGGTSRGGGYTRGAGGGYSRGGGGGISRGGGRRR